MSFNIKDHPQKRQNLLTAMCDNLLGFSFGYLFGLHPFIKFYDNNAGAGFKTLIGISKNSFINNQNTY